MTADPLKALIKILQDDVEVAALASTRIYGDELPRDDADSMPQKAVVLQLSGGGGFPIGTNDYIEHRAFRFDARCYGETPFEAGRLQREVSVALRKIGSDPAAQRVYDGVLIHWVNDAGGLLSLRDSVTDWPYKFESFQCFHAESEVTE